MADEELEMLVHEHEPARLRLACLLCRDAQRAEDLVQDALVHVLRRWRSAAVSDHPFAYARKVLINEHLAWRRLRRSSDGAQRHRSCAADAAGASHAVRNGRGGLMDRVETLLSDTLAERATTHAPTGAVPLGEPPRQIRQRATVIAVCVVVIAIAVVIASLHRPAHNNPTTHKYPAIHNSFPPIAPIPSGMRVASYNSLSVQVSTRLPTRTWLCGRPIANDVVALDDAEHFCKTVGIAAQPGTVVWLGSPRRVGPYADIPTRPTRVDGHAAQRGYATDQLHAPTGISALVTVPDQNVAIGVTAPTRNAVDAILATIRIAPRDPNGCASSLDAAATTPPGPHDILVPGSPDFVVRCEYGIDSGVRGILIGSYVLNAGATGQLVTALNALRPDPCHCAHGGTAAPGHTEVLYVRYPDNSALRVTGDIGANLDTYVNGAYTVANFSSSIASLLGSLTNQK